MKGLSNFTIHTFGVGVEVLCYFTITYSFEKHSTELMLRIAKLTNGNFYFIENM